MFFYLSKLFPLLVYPLGLACVLLALSLFWRRRARRSTRLVVVSLVVLWLGGNRIVTMILTRSLEWRYTPLEGAVHADAIVVLGGATRAASYPREMHELNEAGDRLLYTVYLYRQGVAPVIVLSGGNAPWVGPEGISEAEVMAEILSTLGIPREVMILEGQSRNTYENAIESHTLLTERGFDKIVLVTSAMHMPRAYKIFVKTGLTVIPAPTDFRLTQTEWVYYTQPDALVQLVNLLPSANDLHLTSSVLKEYIGIVIYGLRGWL